ncbi:helix-turn-helix domain-containing protein [Candidatus Kaiserbacteria bacterium]|nr:helix-turn-helix domain-containing protein [Candidatus Kaiserbacteria bacterium]
MTSKNNQHLEVTAQKLEQHVTTNEAANWLNRKPQTLRKWACLENGPIRPIRINGRLAWRVADIVGLQQGGAA